MVKTFFKTKIKWVIGVVLLYSCTANTDARKFSADIIVYGGTSSGVIAAVEAVKSGKSVILVGPDVHLGGLSASGLGYTDVGNKAAIGGLSREFYHRVWKHYNDTTNWVWQEKSEFGNKGQGTPAIDQDNRTMWLFEPHVAKAIFEEFIAENNIKVFRDEWLDREKGVKMKKGKIVSITMLSGKKFTGKMFIDATYEGDLMAAAGVSYRVGREANSEYGERWNGVQTEEYHHGHHFRTVPKPIDPYWIPGDPSSGLLPRISAEHPGERYSGDHKVQAYCYRMCLTDHPDNMVPFPKPEKYDSTQYELLVRIFDAGWDEWFQNVDHLPNRKTDTNNHGPFSTDNIGMNWDYPDASYERRKEILEEHETYQKGLMWFVANSKRIPEQVHKKINRWGLAKDEFTDNGNWPHQIYVREARRMVGEFVMSENELLKRKPTPNSIGMGSYPMDSHNVQRYVDENGHVQNEGDIGWGTGGPYEIAYGSIIPKQNECENLLVSICVSCTHIAFGSIRMEPVFMILGQSAAAAASLAIDKKVPVQQVPYEELKETLVEKGQRVTFDNLK